MVVVVKQHNYGCRQQKLVASLYELGDRMFGVDSTIFNSVLFSPFVYPFVMVLQDSVYFFY